jgi:vacuolar protein sorting-associated protein 54
MGEFDKVRRAFQEHQNNIYDKLVEIMSGRALAGTKKLKAVGWDQESGGGGGAANEYMETLAKETTTLHRNLTKHLPEGTVRMIMMPVFRNYKDTFGAAYQGVELKTELGRERYVCPNSGIGLKCHAWQILISDRMLRDVEFFQSRLGKIDGFEDAGDYLVKVIKNKQVIAPPPLPAPAPEPAPSPPPAPEPAPALSPPPAVEATNEAEDCKKSGGEHSPELEAQVATGVQAVKNGESNDVSKA